MEHLTKEDKEYLEEMLSNKFHNPITVISEMSKIVRISQILGINTESNLMEYDLKECQNDVLIKTFGYIPDKLDELHKLLIS